MKQRSRAWFESSVEEFLRLDRLTILGSLTAHGEFDLTPAQRDAWIVQVDWLKAELRGIEGAILLEFSIPRMGRRIDVVLISGGAVFAIEFKVGEAEFQASAREQVWDYALDLKNFHEASHHAPIVPILIATGVDDIGELTLLVDEDGVYRPISIAPSRLKETIQTTLETIRGTGLDPEVWARAPYRPTPTIVEAARALYAQHSVEDIARHDAGAANLGITSSRIEELIDESRVNGWKTICFLTGVPGAGKTLVGLNVATRRRDESEPTHAVFLSGNGPLVAVLREALTRDEHGRRLASGIKSRKGKVGESVKAFRVPNEMISSPFGDR